jgi:hypothetical protein
MSFNDNFCQVYLICRRAGIVISPKILLPQGNMNLAWILQRMSPAGFRQGRGHGDAAVLSSNRQNTWKPLRLLAEQPVAIQRVLLP